jgi:DHA1 family tetracycline resistance protein-like MFS transporter
MRKEKIIILFTVLVDVVGFSLVIPTLPYYVAEFGASPSTITLLFASFSFCSFLSAPVLGEFSDRLGRRPVLITSIVATAVGWFVFSSAHTIWLLFLGRIIEGIAAGKFSAAQSTMVDLAQDEKERAANLGIVGATFGIGFMIGPVLGGLLSAVSHVFPFWVACGLATINAISALLFLPETHRHREVARPFQINPFVTLLRAGKDPSLRTLYSTWIIFGLSLVTGQSVFALFVKDVFSFSAFQTGLSFAFVGIIVALNQTLLLNKFWLKRFGNRSIQMLMLAVLAASYMLFATKSEWMFYISLLAFGTGQAVLRIVITNIVAGNAGPERRGEAIGVLSALMSACMAVAPVFSGYLFEIDHTVPYIIAVVFLLIGVWIVQRDKQLSLVQIE